MRTWIKGRARRAGEVDENREYKGGQGGQGR